MPAAWALRTDKDGPIYCLFCVLMNLIISSPYREHGYEGAAVIMHASGGKCTMLILVNVNLMFSRHYVILDRLKLLMHSSTMFNSYPTLHV